jgi:hypothetical protein
MYHNSFSHSHPLPPGGGVDFIRTLIREPATPQMSVKLGEDAVLGAKAPGLALILPLLLASSGIF